MASPESTSQEGQKSKHIFEDDKDFDPSAEDIIDEIDDEATLEEEERLGSNGGVPVQEELDDLKRESEVPSEELLAYHERMRNEAQGNEEDDENDDEEDEDFDEGDRDGDDDDDKGIGRSGSSDHKNESTSSSSARQNQLDHQSSNDSKSSDNQEPGAQSSSYKQIRTYSKKDFISYLDELKNSHKDHTTELTALKIKKKEVEIKLKLLNKRYEEELGTFNDIRVEHILKNSGGKEYVDRLKDKSRLQDDTIRNLEQELQSMRNEVSIWRSKFHEAEKQCNSYYQAFKDLQVKKVQLEAELKATNSQSINRSSASSFIDSVPPPPPIEIPTMNEILHSSSHEF